jgi:plasmid stabilization system protein ParE
MPRPVLITARALRAVKDAVAWKSKYSALAAARWHAALLKKVQTLEDNPEQWPLAAEAALLGIELREMLFGKRRNVYRILFTVSANRVTVHHVRHAAQDWLTPESIDPEEEM